MKRRTALGVVLGLALGLALSAAAAADDFECVPLEVAVFNERIHVLCANTIKDGGATIRFWAVGTADSERSNRFLSVACTALVSGRKLRFNYTPGDTGGTAFGCLAKDCREPWAITLL